MSTAMTLAGPDRIDQLLGLTERRRTEGGDAPWAEDDRSHWHRALAPLLAGGMEGAVWMIGPSKAPIGYCVVTFGWSVEAGGREAWVEDIYVRPSVRRRGIGREIVNAVSVSLRQGGVKRLNARLPRMAHSAKDFAGACGFDGDSDTAYLSDRQSR